MSEGDHIQGSVDAQTRIHDEDNRGVQNDLANVKDVNRDFKHRCATTESIATDTLARLRLSQAERERIHANRESLISDHQQKSHVIENLERERAIATEQLGRITLELDDLSRN